MRFCSETGHWSLVSKSNCKSAEVAELEAKAEEMVQWNLL